VRRMLTPVGKGRILLAVLYWLAVLAVSVALLIALILFLESRDSSGLDSSGVLSAPAQVGG
jgi:hypothetical protein